MIVSSVALGNVYNVSAFAEVKSCPVGFDSVRFEYLFYHANLNAGAD
jgi:hypothetical protein